MKVDVTGINKVGGFWDTPFTGVMGGWTVKGASK